MTDGETTLTLTFTLSRPAFRRLREWAEKLRMSLDEAAADALEQQLFNYDDYDWGDDPENDPRSPPPPFDPNEPTVSLEEAMAVFSASLERRLAEKG